MTPPRSERRQPGRLGTSGTENIFVTANALQVRLEQFLGARPEEDDAFALVMLALVSARPVLPDFAAAIDVSGLVLTKLDGTAKGGIALAIASELGIPVKLIGIGEQLEDLRPFDAAEFAGALVG